MRHVYTAWSFRLVEKRAIETARRGLIRPAGGLPLQGACGMIAATENNGRGHVARR
jgi:hypothetical protein